MGRHPRLRRRGPRDARRRYVGQVTSGVRLDLRPRQAGSRRRSRNVTQSAPSGVDALPDLDVLVRSPGFAPHHPLRRAADAAGVDADDARRTCSSPRSAHTAPERRDHRQQGQEHDEHADSSARSTRRRRRRCSSATSARRRSMRLDEIATRAVRHGDRALELPVRRPARRFGPSDRRLAASLFPSTSTGTAACRRTTARSCASRSRSVPATAFATTCARPRRGGAPRARQRRW